MLVLIMMRQRASIAHTWVDDEEGATIIGLEFKARNSGNSVSDMNTERRRAVESNKDTGDIWKSNVGECKCVIVLVH
jgi:hypothetical protein